MISLTFCKCTREMNATHAAHVCILRLLIFWFSKLLLLPDISTLLKWLHTKPIHGRKAKWAKESKSTAVFSTTNMIANRKVFKSNVLHQTKVNCNRSKKRSESQYRVFKFSLKCQFHNKQYQKTSLLYPTYANNMGFSSVLRTEFATVINITPFPDCSLRILLFIHNFMQVI